MINALNEENEKDETNLDALKRRGVNCIINSLEIVRAL